MKKLLALLLVLLALFSLCSCSEVADVLVDELINEGLEKLAESALVLPENNYAQGAIGDTFRTAFFDFTVESAAFCNSYEGYFPKADTKLLDVVITVENTFGEELPMLNSDFQIQWHNLGNSPQDYAYGLSFPNSSTVMPEYYTQRYGETLQYHIIYQVPAQAEEFSLSYLEVYEDNSTGASFFCFFNLT